MIEDIQRIVEKANNKLYELEQDVIRPFKFPQKPVFFIVGPPRSGTTLLLQTIIQHYKIAYINNFIAKFWDAPVVGAILYRSFNPLPALPSYESDGGFTKGINGPHEFGYFWKRFFHYGNCHEIKEEDYPAIDSKTLNREIAGLEYVFQQPVIFKNPPALSLQINFLYQYVPNSIFIYIRRDPLFVGQSIYRKRMEVYNDLNQWYSTKPSEYQQLSTEPPIRQIAGQVYYITEKIEHDLALIPAGRKSVIDYEDFCLDPIQWINKIPEMGPLPDLPDDRNASGLRFNVKDEVLIDGEDWKSLQRETDRLFRK